MRRRKSQLRLQIARLSFSPRAAKGNSLSLFFVHNRCTLQSHLFIRLLRVLFVVLVVVVILVGVVEGLVGRLGQCQTRVLLHKSLPENPCIISHCVANRVDRVPIIGHVRIRFITYVLVMSNFSFSLQFILFNRSIMFPS